MFEEVVKELEAFNDTDDAKRQDEELEDLIKEGL